MQMLELKLAGGPDAPSRARHALSSLELDSATESVLPLLVTELVANSVLVPGRRRCRSGPSPGALRG